MFSSLTPSHLRKAGIVSTVLIVLASFGAGATRNNGGILEALGLSFLSYGHGAGLMNIMLWIGMLGFIGVWAVTGRLVVRKLIDARAVTILLLSWIAPLVFAAPILSRDVYSYLMQGAMLRDGFDPYSQGAAVNPGPMLLEVSHDWRNTTTPYGPLHLWIGDIITSIVGDNVTLGIILYKLVSLVGFTMIVYSVPKIATCLGANPALAQWLCVANPVMVFHLIGGMHNESLMVGLVSIGILAALRHRYGWAVVAIAVSVSLKATAVFALPFVVWMGFRYLENKSEKQGIVLSRQRRFGLFVFTGSWMAALTLGVVAAVTALSGASWGWVSQISGNSKVINPLALPSLLASMITPFGKLFDDNFAYNDVLDVTRPASQALMLLGLVVVWWIFRKNDATAVRGIVAAYAVAVVFNAVTLPWYYTSLINLAAVTPISRNLTKWIAGLSMVIAASFTGSGNHLLYNVPWMVTIALGAWWLTQFIFADRVLSDSKSPSTVPVA